MPVTPQVNEKMLPHRLDLLDQCLLVLISGYSACGISDYIAP